LKLGWVGISIFGAVGADFIDPPPSFSLSAQNDPSASSGFVKYSRDYLVQDWKISNLNVTTPITTEETKQLADEVYESDVVVPPEEKIPDATVLKPKEDTKVIPTVASSYLLLLTFVFR